MGKLKVILPLVVFSILLMEVVFAAGEGHVIITLSEEALREGPCGAVLESTGIGKLPQGRPRAQARLMAERAAKVRAYRNLIQTVDRLGPLLTDGNGVISATGYIRGARIVEKVYMPDGRVKVRIALDIHFSNPESACELWVAEKVKTFGLPVLKMDRKVVEISEEEWVDLNR